MVKVTVKFDSKVHVLDVPEEMTIKDLKELIAPTVNLPVDSQKWVLKGRVLQDEKKVSDYDLSTTQVHLLKKTETATSSGDPSVPVPTTLSGAPPIPRAPQALSGAFQKMLAGNQHYHGRGDAMDCDEEPSLASALKHIPEEWVDTFQLDIRRQLGMPTQLPFSDGFVRLFTKSSN